MLEQLKLDNQLCFRLYTASRLITQAYHPLLSEHGLTYPQYLVLMALWEKDAQPVNDIAKRLYLETNTVTPLLKRMEAAGLVTRCRNKSAACPSEQPCHSELPCHSERSEESPAAPGIQVASCHSEQSRHSECSEESPAAPGTAAAAADGRQVIVSLTPAGRALEGRLADVPARIGAAVLCDSVTPDTVPELFSMLDGIISRLSPSQPEK